MLKSWEREFAGMRIDFVKVLFSNSVLRIMIVRMRKGFHHKKATYELACIEFY